MTPLAIVSPNTATPTSLQSYHICSPSLQSSRVKELEIQLEEEKHYGEELNEYLRGVTGQLCGAGQDVVDTDLEQKVEVVERELIAARKKLTVSWLLFIVTHDLSYVIKSNVCCKQQVLFMGELCVCVRMNMRIMVQ